MRNRFSRRNEDPRLRLYLTLVSASVRIGACVQGCLRTCTHFRLQAEAKDQSPWLGNDGQMVQNIKDTFGNAIIVRFLWPHDPGKRTRYRLEEVH